MILLVTQALSLIILMSFPSLINILVESTSLRVTVRKSTCLNNADHSDCSSYQLRLCYSEPMYCPTEDLTHCFPDDLDDLSAGVGSTKIYEFENWEERYIVEVMDSAQRNQQAISCENIAKRNKINTTTVVVNLETSSKRFEFELLLEIFNDTSSTYVGTTSFADETTNTTSFAFTNSTIRQPESEQGLNPIYTISIIITLVVIVLFAVVIFVCVKKKYTNRIHNMDITRDKEERIGHNTNSNDILNPGNSNADSLSVQNIDVLNTNADTGIVQCIVSGQSNENTQSGQITDRFNSDHSIKDTQNGKQNIEAINTNADARGVKGMDNIVTGHSNENTKSEPNIDKLNHARINEVTGSGPSIPSGRTFDVINTNKDTRSVQGTNSIIPGDTNENTQSGASATSIIAGNCNENALSGNTVETNSTKMETQRNNNTIQDQLREDIKQLQDHVKDQNKNLELRLRRIETLLDTLIKPEQNVTSMPSPLQIKCSKTTNSKEETSLTNERRCHRKRRTHKRIHDEIITIEREHTSDGKNLQVVIKEKRTRKKTQSYDYIDP